MAVFVGIDPGAKGSLCFLDIFESSKTAYWLPTTDLPHLLFNMLVNTNNRGLIRMIGIEDVHAIYGTSAGSNFQFGYNVGLLHGIVGATGFGIDVISPKTWQAGVGIRFKKSMTTAQKKHAVAARALQLYPKADLYGPKKGLLDGRADALMIAHYLSIKYGGNNT